MIKGNLRPNDLSILPEAINLKMSELVALKANIAKANSKVYSKIFELSELKSLAFFYKRLQINDEKIAVNKPIKLKSHSVVISLV